MLVFINKSANKLVVDVLMKPTHQYTGDKKHTLVAIEETRNVNTVHSPQIPMNYWHRMDGEELLLAICYFVSHMEKLYSLPRCTKVLSSVF